MFEKEAVEYAERTKTEKEIEVLNTVHDWGQESLSPNERRLFEGIQDRKEAREQGFKDGAEFGYKKANEWHYPSKGELPQCDEETQLIFYVNCYYEVDGETLIRKRTVLGFYKKSFLNDDVKLFVEKSKGYENEHLSKDVIAWKEIVLPELKESE